MVFVPYPPAIEVVAVRMALEGFSKPHICQTLGKTISRQSFQQWMLLYQETKAIVCSPESYETRGWPPTLSSEEC
ncbi:hypothetical protein PTTG_27152 [Puccinia triticina 1-1 BBBD Race 1]|uniref:Transposase n=1 Tax=Puccinia triticina (isolate 1-1 / race 1 (BBBD)) TaxID=630390 RepID=A0A180GN33_PUCT1|nr:hypothetical protein PTTG_27152 [Puccinia triticina 1-1 BBBD Race 1]